MITREKRARLLAQHRAAAAHASHTRAVARKRGRAAARADEASAQLGGEQWAEEAPPPEAPKWIRDSHSSHSLFYTGGFFCCQTCGCVSSAPRRSRLLASCPGEGATGPAKMLLQGRRPVQWPSWPDQRAQPEARRRPWPLALQRGKWAIGGGAVAETPFTHCCGPSGAG